VTACDTRREVYGTERRAILTHSPELHEHQARGFDGTTLAKATGSWMSWPPRWPAVKPAEPGTRVEAEITKITRDPWARRVISWQLNGDNPRDLRLTWSSTPPRGPRWKARSSASTC
jgi:hypothetical protein